MRDKKQSNDEKRPLRICYFGTYRVNYPRNQVMIHGLRQNGAIVDECHVTLWHSVADRVEQAGGGWKHPRFWLRIFKAYWSLLRAHMKTPSYDVMLVGYPGQFDVYLGRLLSWWRRKPMALDIMMSIHLIAEERGLTKKSPITGKLIFLIEKYGLKLPDLLFADTPEYQTYYTEKYNLTNSPFQLIPLGADDRIYSPRLNINPPEDTFRVLFYGTFIPLHGIETMLRAAALLQDKPRIQFVFYGDGQEKPKAEHLAKELGLTNTQFRGWIDKKVLPEEIAKSHICLGVFGTTKQSRCTIQNKIWEGMMMQRPVITGDAETIREELTHLKHVYLVERANPKALADGILTLEQSPSLRQNIAETAYLHVQNYTIQALGHKVKGRLLDLTAS